MRSAQPEMTEGAIAARGIADAAAILSRRFTLQATNRKRHERRTGVSY